MLPPVFLFMRDYPEPMGLQPDGDAAPPAQQTAVHRADERVWTSQEVLRSPHFWRQALGYMFAFAMLQVTLVHQFPFITTRGFDTTTAALILSVYALSAGLSKFGWGYLADRFSLYKVAVASNWLAAIGLVILLFANDLPTLWVYAIVGGTGIGGLPALQAMVTAGSFGRRSYGTVAGLLNPMNSIAAAIAVPFAGYLFDLTGTYTISFSVIIVLVALSSLSLLGLSNEPQPAARLK